MGPRLLPSPGAAPLARDCPVPGGRVMPSRERLPVSRVRGAACNGTDHAGESPAAAIARFSCVAMSDGREGRPSCRKLRQKSSRPQERSDLTGGRAKTGAAANANTTASRAYPTRIRSWGLEQPSLFALGEGQWVLVKVTGQCNQCLLRRMGGGTSRMGDDPKQGRCRGHRAAHASRRSRQDGRCPRDWRIGS